MRAAERNTDWTQHHATMIWNIRDFQFSTNSENSGQIGWV